MKENYLNVHYLIRKQFGNATKCENPNCIGKSKFFEWAHLHNKPMEPKREYFKELCRSCHRQYDRESYINAAKKIYANGFSEKHKENLRQAALQDWIKRKKIKN